MQPADLIMLLSVGTVISIIIVLTLWKMPKYTRNFLMALGISYLIFFAAYPSMRAYLHAQKYHQLEKYLQNHYPNEQFYIEERDYKIAIQFGDFYVSNKESPNKGHVYRVKKRDEIIRLPGSWERVAE